MGRGLICCPGQTKQRHRPLSRHPPMATRAGPNGCLQLTTAPSGQPQWIDCGWLVGGRDHHRFYVDGVLPQHGPPAAQLLRPKGQGPAQSSLPNTALPTRSRPSRVWYYAHYRALDGVSTIGRRFVRRSRMRWQLLMRSVGSLDGASRR